MFTTPQTFVYIPQFQIPRNDPDEIASFAGDKLKTWRAKRLHAWFSADINFLPS